MSQLLLGHAAIDPELTDSLAYGSTSTFPCGHTLWIVLARSGGHDHHYVVAQHKCLYY
ncbi:hypothetical protein ABQE62_29480 [Mycolicibacterium fortuitum]